MWGRGSSVSDFDRASPSVDVSHYMSLRRFEELKQLFPVIFQEERFEDSDDWWRIRGAVDGFNENRRKTVAASFKKVLDELMSATRPRKLKTGGLPHITYLPLKPKSLGMFFD